MKKLLLLFILMPFLGFNQAQIGSDINGEAAQDNSGISLSMSSDGTIVAIGASGNSSNGNYSGHVRVFKYQDSDWIQIGQDIDGEAVEDNSGVSISISSDGTVVAIGATGNDANGAFSGHVRVYSYQGSNWVQLGQDIDGLGLSGKSVSLSSDGTAVAIGAPSYNVNGFFSGQVKVYNFIGSDWVQLGQDIDGEAADDHSGQSVSLSSDGTIVAIASYLSNENAFGAGKIKVYNYQNNDWVQMGQDVYGDAAVDQLGWSINLSSDGMVLAAGANANNGDGTNLGYVKVYGYQGNDWVQIGEDIDGEAGGDNAGRSVSLSSDGSLVAIGSGFNNSSGGNDGYVRVFKNQINNWIKVGGNIDGKIVSFSSNGSILSIGSYNYSSINGIYSGRTRVYSITIELATLEVIEDILGNNNGINVTASQLNSITGVSGAIEGVNYTTALDNGIFVDENNPTASEIQAIIEMVNATLSVNDNDILSFKIYPNPTKTQFTIQLNNTVELENVNIYDNLGKLVSSSKETVIDSSNLAAGLYIVEIQTNKGKGSKKLIIK